MLATDMHNPQFSGATHPDAALFVEIEMHEPVDPWASMVASVQEERTVKKKLPPQPYIRIKNPGDNTWEEHRPLTESDKRRFPNHWMRFQIDQGEMAAGNAPGWRIEEWPELDGDMLRDLKYQRFQTVEQIAGASDKQLQGMGIGGTSLREKARIALRDRILKESRAEIEKRDVLIGEQGAALKAVQEQMAMLMEAQGKREVLTARK